jgi:hypothetical protein
MWRFCRALVASSLLISAVYGCTVDTLRVEGRPCSSTKSCGPSAVCDLAKLICVPRGPDGVVDLPRPDLRPDIPDLMPIDLATDLPDGDGDSVPDTIDNCPTKANSDQKDTDNDKVGDLCDNCPLVPNSAQVDTDKDTVGDACDNCAAVSNVDQKDIDKDGLGDVCDPDRDGDTIPNYLDPNPDTADTVYYFSSKPGQSIADFVAPTTWSANGDQLCETGVATTDSTAPLLSGKVTQSNYLVETKFTVTAANTSTSSSPTVGLMVRYSTTGETYYCVVDVKLHRVVLAVDTGTYTIVNYSTTNTVPGMGPFRVRAVAKNKLITCTEMQSGQSVSTSTASLLTGTVGLVSYLASSCFDYLMVLNAP